MKNLKTYILIAAIAMLFNSCAKDGATGPQGPAGAKGNANVTEATYIVNPSAWTVSAPYICVVTDAAIVDATKDIVDVSVSPNGSFYAGMPTSNLLVNGDVMEFIYVNGAITFEYLGSSSPAQTLTFKVAVIPPQ